MNISHDSPTTPSTTKNHDTDGLSVGTVVHDVRNKIVDLKDGAQKTLGHSIDTIGGVLRAHPFAAVGIALGAGLGLGFLLAGVIRARM